ncbi:putative sporulation protein YtxC [Acetivibrio mesophilus]|uniref:Putative sporulation protein YtxC n=1 Tax=Acetivibrio mesophilus TaxID=2487273 RepID=A0A4Q0I4W1_9FIRM|nr:putative sporulation protein YtxC [Acetivibrio mesophilus]ODM26808.1 sporulation protein [Clostridium sp. Bc-iso-3]RXE59326.1 putative sporulation protein YtxC [Acetivibrio mesophilus]HHV28403.1 putative sporulation protein YtxC [Clostridium sp.]
MQFLCIGVNEHADSLKNCLINELSRNNKKNRNYLVRDVVDSEGSTSIICTFADGDAPSDMDSHLYNELVLNVSTALATFIIDKYEEKLIYRIINCNYGYFTQVERKEIQRLALAIIKNEERNLLNSFFQIRRKNIIIKRLLEYFECSNSVILDGFVNFRLKDYMKDLEEIVDKAMDDFLMEREYREFIRLLRYFVDIQEPKFNAVHIIVGYDNKYILLDENKNEITNDCLQEFMNDIPEGEINYDDLLVSFLITMAPRKLLIHGAKSFRNKELLETIKNVFWGKVVICSECELCIVNMVRSENKS